MSLHHKGMILHENASEYKYESPVYFKFWGIIVWLFFFVVFFCFSILLLYGYACVLSFHLLMDLSKYKHKLKKISVYLKPMIELSLIL